MMVSQSEAAVPWMTAGGMEVYDDTGIIDEDFRRAVAKRTMEIANSLSKWTESNQDVSLDVFQAPTGNAYSIMRACNNAMRDDVISNIEESLRSISIQELRWSDPKRPGVAEHLDRWSQEVDLRGVCEVIMMELFKHGQSVVAVDWDYTTLKHSDKNTGRAKSVFQVPKKIVTLDPLCVVPYSGGMFGEWKLAWHLDTLRADEMRRLGYDLTDGIFDGWIEDGELTVEEQGRLAKLGVSWTNLVRLDPKRVFRIRETDVSYERFSEPSLKTVFPYLSLKSELMKTDSIALRGTANYILIVRQGSDNLPATNAEMMSLRESFRTLAKVPIIVSDHRLQVDILTPDTSKTLDPQRYNLIDRRIAARVLRTPEYEGIGGGGDGGDQYRNRAIKEVLEGRRERIRRLIMSLIREEDSNNSSIRLEFVPSRIQVDNGSVFANLMQNARDRRLISRRTFLDYMGLDQEVEFESLKHEKGAYDDVFNERVPFNSPDNVGGRPVGGGDSSRNDITSKTAGGNTKKEEK